MRIFARSMMVVFAMSLLGALLASESRLGAVTQGSKAATQPSIPCQEPSTPERDLLLVNPAGVLAVNPNLAEVIEDRVVTEPLDIGTEFPSLLDGTDSGLQDPHCAPSFDMDEILPGMPLPSGPTLTIPTVSLPLTKIAGLPSIFFAPPADCLRSQRPSATCGPPLDCRLPFCGRDVILIHGLIDESLRDLVRARLHLGPTAVLARWPQSPNAFNASNGYFRIKAEENWEDFLRNKLGPAYRNAGVPYGPRFLIAAWPVTQRMEYGVHAVLSQIAGAMRNGTNVMTLDLSGSPTMVGAGLTRSGFCGRGCIMISGSTGGPLAVSAMNIAANASRPWTTSSLRALPGFIKGHVAFHPALGGAEIGWQALALANGATGGCAAVPDLLNAFGGGGWGASDGGNCAAAQSLNQSVLVDLSPPVMNTVWRPFMTATPSSVTNVVPTVVVAGAHPTKLMPFHWQAPVLPGYDDGVLSVDSQLGRPWTPLMPRSLTFNAWGLAGARYYDRGSPTARAIPYFLDQTFEVARRPLARAAAPNPFLTPNGMVLPSVSLFEVPAASSGLPNVFSFLQSTAGHLFRRRVGNTNRPDSQPNNAVNGCAPGSYSYQPTGNLYGPQANVNEESRAVFDSSVYTTRGRNHFAFVEAATGPIPLLSPTLAGAIEGEAKGRYIRLRIKFLHIDRTFWIWKRQYVRMRGWQCRDEIDYAFEFAFRR
jgi:hypothetical protein